MRFFWKLMSVTLAGTLLASCASETSDFIPEPGNQGGDEGGNQGGDEGGNQGGDEGGNQGGDEGGNQSVGTIEDCKISYVKDSLTAGESFESYSTVKVSGVTGTSGTHTGLKGQFGYVIADPSKKLDDVVWSDAQFNDKYGGENADQYDEYMSTNVPSSTGMYVVFYRYSPDGGKSWTYCDGQGVITSYDLDYSRLKIVNVKSGSSQGGQEETGDTPNIEWCKVTWPTIDYKEENNSFENGAPIGVYSQVYAPGVTGANGTHTGIRGEFGYVPSEAGKGYADITWVDAVYNDKFDQNSAPNNDEYMIANDLKLNPGYYVVFYRYTTDSGQVVVCDGEGMLTDPSQFALERIVSIEVK